MNLSFKISRGDLQAEGCLYSIFLLALDMPYGLIALSHKDIHCPACQIVSIYFMNK